MSSRIRARKLRLSRQLTLARRDGAWLADVSMAYAPFPIQSEFLPLLEAFSSPATPEAGVAAFLSRYADGGDTRQFKRDALGLVRQLRERGILIAEVGPPPPTGSSFATASSHLAMLADHARTVAYREALGIHAPGRVVVDIGCGSGVLSCFAARAGASHVYAIEETEIIDVAREIARRNGLADRISFIRGNSAGVDLPQRADVICAELLSDEPLAERIVSTMADATRRFGKPDSVLIPDQLEIRAVGLESRRFLEDEYLLDHKAIEAGQLGTVHGLDFGPLIDLYGEELRRKRESLSYPADLGRFIGQELPGPGERILSRDLLVASFDLAGPEIAGRQTRGFELEISAGGRHNAMLTYFVSSLRGRLLLTNSPWVQQRAHNWRQVVSRLEPRSVTAGQRLPVRANFSPKEHSAVRWDRG